MSRDTLHVVQCILQPQALPLYSIPTPVPASPAILVPLSLNLTHRFGHVLDRLFWGEDTLVQIRFCLFAQYTLAEGGQDGAGVVADCDCR